MALKQPNEAVLNYWQRSGYKASHVDDVCNAINEECMAARVSFNGNGEVEVTITSRTWQRQEGHYPTILSFFSEVAQQPSCKDIKGSFIVWLEDGLWEWQQMHPRKAPVLAFGRQIQDHCTFLIPDPAFLGSQGYVQDQTEIRDWESSIKWQNKKKTVFWRGAATGIGIEHEPWKSTARARLTLLATELNNPNILDAKITKISHLSSEQQHIITAHNVCGEACDFRKFLDYLYLVDADGYCCAWRSLFLKLATNSVVLKMHSDYEQWYYCNLVAWKHYVPLRHDLKDFNQAFDWLQKNPAAAMAITAQAHQLLGEITYQAALEDVGRLCAAILECGK